MDEGHTLGKNHKQYGYPTMQGNRANRPLVSPKNDISDVSNEWDWKSEPKWGQISVHLLILSRQGTCPGVPLQLSFLTLV
jgi:hypothetical protein